MIEDRLPDILPTDAITVEDEPFEFEVRETSGTRSVTRQYTPSKAPFDRVVEITGVVNGVETTFTRGTDYELVDDDGDGSFERIVWPTDQGTQPDDNTTFFVTYQAESILSRYVGAFDDDLETAQQQFEETIDAKQVDSATRGQLIALSQFFGELGRPRGRSTNDYRVFLRSLVQAFDGRGTSEDVRFAIGTGLRVDPDTDVRLREDFATTTYQVELFDWTAHKTGTIRQLADLSDPAGVERLDPVYYFVDEGRVAPGPRATSIGDIKTVADTTSLALVSDETTADSGPSGLSSTALEPLSTDGFILSFPDRPGARITLDPSDAVVATDTVAPTATPSPGVESTSAATLPGLSSPQFGGLSTTQVPPLSI